MSRSCIYLDNHATTRCAPQVVDAMLPYFSEQFGNPASIHHPFGWDAEDAVRKAQGSVARLLGARDHEIVFTSGATESNQLALLSGLLRRPGSHVVVSAVEHKSIASIVESLREFGCTATVVPVDSTGRVDPEAVAQAIGPHTVVVSVMHANHEVGTINPIAEIGALCRERGVLMHTDATQSFGKVPIDVDAMSIDLLSLSGHKCYGPKGIGALYVRSGVRITPLCPGGGQQGGLRGGTLPVPLIAGLGVASELARDRMTLESEHTRSLRDRLWRALESALPGVQSNGDPRHRLPGNLNVAFEGVDSELILESVRSRLAVSTGSACSSSRLEPSYVLTAMGLSTKRAQSSLRFGIGRFNTVGEIDEAAALVVDAVVDIRRSRLHTA
ncbi:MAG: cysteine desulfurase [Myxococcales bacterium]|nr:cysteine desulfurase [Myxococcales bacterium]